MPLLSTRGAASAKGFGFGGGKSLISVNYLVVAGGGGGASPNAGGGGAGGVRMSTYAGSNDLPLNGTPIKIAAGTYPVTVGAGGNAGRYAPSTDGSKGTPSSFSTISSEGGGINFLITGPTPLDTRTGGSGAGASEGDPAGWAGNTPPTNPPQGNPGGNLQPEAGSGGGGGGHEPGNSNGQGYGGDGAECTITGSLVYYGGGGGAGGDSRGRGSTPGPGGAGGGGNGAPGGTATAGSGTANTGGGGGGGRFPGPSSGGAGGSGIVVIRVPSIQTISVAPGTNTTSTAPNGDKIATFTVPGTYTLS
jgi:hypothetical protein